MRLKLNLPSISSEKLIEYMRFLEATQIQYNEGSVTSCKLELLKVLKLDTTSLSVVARILNSYVVKMMMSTIGSSIFIGRNICTNVLVTQKHCIVETLLNL